MYNATLTSKPYQSHNYRGMAPDGYLRTEWAYRPQYVFNLKIGESSCDICLEALKEFPDRDRFNTLLPHAVETASILFKSGELLHVFSSNQFNIFSQHKTMESVDLENPPVISLELSEKEYARLLKECDKKNQIGAMIMKFCSYIFGLDSALHDEYAKPCFDFIEQCLGKSIDMQYGVRELGYIRSAFFNPKLKSDGLQVAKRALYSKIGPPNFYEFEPHISTEVEKLYQSIQ